MLKPVKNSAVIHVLLRVGTYHDKSLKINLMEEHNKLSSKNGTVFLGKAGRGLQHERRNQLTDSIKRYGKSHLFVVHKTLDHFNVLETSLNKILPSNKTPKPNLFPAYYHDIANEITVWFEIGILKACNESRLNKLVLLSNGRPALETLRSCRTSLMLLKDKEN